MMNPRNQEKERAKIIIPVITTVEISIFSTDERYVGKETKIRRMSIFEINIISEENLTKLITFFSFFSALYSGISFQTV